MMATGINKEGCHFDVASGPFKYHFGALMWLCSTLKKSSPKKNKKQKSRNSSLNHIEFLDPTQLPSWLLGTSDTAQMFRYIQFPVSNVQQLHKHSLHSIPWPRHSSKLTFLHFHAS